MGLAQQILTGYELGKRYWHASKWAVVVTEKQSSRQGTSD